MNSWADYSPEFTPGGSPSFEEAAWDRRESRIAQGWDPRQAQAAYEADMSSEGYVSSEGYAEAS